MQFPPDLIFLLFFHHDFFLLFLFLTLSNLSQVCLEYPTDDNEKLQGFDSFPPTTTRRCVDLSEYSPWMRKSMEMMKDRPSRVPKLIADMRTKTHYRIHLPNLVYLLRLGLRLVTVHRVAR